MRIDGKDAFINRLGRWSDPVAVAKAHAISAQIWSDYQQGVFDRSLMAYQPLRGGKQVALLEALRVRAESKRQAAAIHAHKLLERYGKPIRNRSDAAEFLCWLREERGLSDCTITSPEGDAQQLHQALLLLKRSRCLNVSAFCRQAIAEKLERLEQLETQELVK